MFAVRQPPEAVCNFRSTHLIMGDEQQSAVEYVLHAIEQAEHAGSSPEIRHRHMFVGDQQARTRGEGAIAGDILFPASGEAAAGINLHG